MLVALARVLVILNCLMGHDVSPCYLLLYNNEIACSQVLLRHYPAFYVLRTAQVLLLDLLLTSLLATLSEMHEDPR